MNHVIRHIEYLVHRHDCVVLPKWGAFIAHYQPACYDEALGVMYPPMREISFSTSVGYDDGLLASSIARKETMTFGRASQLVEEELSSMRHQLGLDGEISLGRIGRFIRQDEGSVIFEPSSNQPAISGAGFEPFSIRPLLEKVREDAVVAGRIEAPCSGRLSRLGLRAVKAAAAVAALVGISVVLLRPSFSRNDDMASIAPVISGRSSQAANVPSLSEAPSLNILVPNEDDSANKVQLVANVDTDDADATAVNAVEAEKMDIVAAVRMNAADRYCLVVASLPSKSLAEKYVRENSSLNLGILDKDGKFRVYAATGNTTNEALLGKKLNGVASDAWVCSMR
ncbi:MAG: hypothetical protein NC453_30375 [Muribaculum sp.]|nr:hypothetical protein [Muribaculum sp.]